MESREYYRYNIMESQLKPQYVGLSNPYEIWVFSQPGRCYMVRLKPKEKYRPSRVGLTAIFKITYHAKR